MEHAHQNVGRTGRVRQRTQDVEHGFDAQLTPYRRYVFHRRVVIRCEHKAHALLRDALCNRSRGEVDIQPQSLQHIGAAAFAADAAPAVLADFGPGCGGHEHGASRDVEGMRAVAPGSHNVYQVRRVSHLDLGRKLAHDLRRSGNFPNGFFFDA